MIGFVGIERRDLGARAFFCIAALTVFLAPAWAQAFGFNDVAQSAEALSKKNYTAPKSNLPDVFAKMKYADYQQMRLRPDRAHWKDHGSRFTLGFYHQGMHFNTPIKINEIKGKKVVEIKFNADMFDYGSLHIDRATVEKLGFAGFKVLYPINNEKKTDDELATFLGASYFRVIGKGQVYGLSARGLAIDTALPSGEEFPAFKEFWIERPQTHSKELVIYALLDSPRATGAYRFTIKAGDETLVDVKSRVFMRDNVGRLGIAPLTSMYLYGANQPWPQPNYRPRLHDSDGLALHAANGEWIWRPLNNPRRLGVSAFSMENPRGFGLLQREREFRQYEDLDDHYELRPSLWIEPKGNWGRGSVQLVEIPTGDETNDNIVAFWVPADVPARGTPLDFQYSMRWTLNNRLAHDSELPWVMQTRRSREENKGPDLIRRWDGSVTYIIDFVGPALDKLKPEQALQAAVSSDENGDIVDASIRPNKTTGGQRLTLKVKVKDNEKPVELRAALRNGETVLTETWSYQVPPYANSKE
jgi:glucans biosynthesis protein